MSRTGATLATAALLLLLVAPASLVHAYKYGDPVSMLKRSQYKGFRTEWSEVPAAEAPKFGLSKEVRLNPLSDAKEYVTSDEFKLQLSFSGDQLLTHWITLTDGRAHYVQSIDFEFEYAQGYVNHVKWRATYYDDTTSKPDHIVFRYHWHEILESDPAVGVTLLLLVCSVIAWLSAALILLGYDRTNAAGSTLAGKGGRSAGGGGAAASPAAWKSDSAHYS